MSPLSRRCIQAAFVCLAAGIALGIVFGINRTYGAYFRPLHATLNLWGWVTLLIYGMGYHMLPRFTGRNLSHPALASVQMVLAVTGVVVSAVGYTLYGLALPNAFVLIPGALCTAVAAVLFAWLMASLLISTPRTI